ncbi:imidazole glycerol phosphate synthase subunit HisF [Segetibacter sp. 3557_3]|uniref:AglZ/HisF2 family acetamidino modification protein n=1 Tax=Segetibacter sp. 3557_3 TaxID=2547429 RepID=UPI001058A87B|nr:AglZ/HisF2 family acetamidino modification protein [Segetibacter sp. 3557_3]TDH23300.1 imidazole glycerol phosphate synthase subunit HisF [Segetibacter sp. 3557_3]
MRRIRVIPTLLIQNGGLVKSVKFQQHRYVGDPINAVKIFNDKEVDELVLLDISASAAKRSPDMHFISQVASEAFMPLSYGGGVTKAHQVQQLISAGIEKVIINTSAYTNPQLISDGAKLVGSQSVVVSIDVKKNFWGKQKVFVQNGTVNTNENPVDYARRMESLGAGELLLNAIEKDGTFTGYDEELIRSVSAAVNIPVITIGGAAEISDFEKAIKVGASAVAAGSMFVFQRPHRAVLISYPSQQQLSEQLFSNI